MPRLHPLVAENRAPISRLLARIEKASGLTVDEVASRLSEPLSRPAAAVKTRWYRWRAESEAPPLRDLAIVIDYAEAAGWIRGGQFASRVLMEGRYRGYISGRLGVRADKEFDEITQRFAALVRNTARETGKGRVAVAEELISEMRRVSTLKLAPN